MIAASPRYVAVCAAVWRCEERSVCLSEAAKERPGNFPSISRSFVREDSISISRSSVQTNFAAPHQHQFRFRRQEGPLFIFSLFAVTCCVVVASLGNRATNAQLLHARKREVRGEARAIHERTPCNGARGSREARGAPPRWCLYDSFFCLLAFRLGV